ncbi:MAG: hypothetical protein IPG71_04750 [bacterium]|nr:hypothetical protein [bacterium]
MQLIAAVILMLCAWQPSLAATFHSDGVASCGACHTLHNLENGRPVNPAPDNNYLLVMNSASDLCLSCHSNSLGAVWSDSPMHPAPEFGAGNFVFIGAPNMNDAPDGLTVPLSGSHGVHNCVAPSQNALQDPVHASSSRRQLPSAELRCTSCHDPHGNQNFRMLRGAGPLPGTNYMFVEEAPLAQGLTLNGLPESRSQHTAYQAGWTSWCANCHGLYHDEGSVGFEHPVDETLPNEVVTSYGLYDGSGNPTGGNPLLSYLPQVPYEDMSMTTVSTIGPTAASRIMCMSCHRAHGSSAVDLGRWDFRTVNIRMDGFQSGSYPLPNPYGSGTIERQLCVKCHERDTRTHGFSQACIECHRYDTALTKVPSEVIKRRP